MRADFHGGPEHSTLHSKTGYIDARPQSCQIDEDLLQRTAAPYIRGSSASVSPNRLSYGCPATIFLDMPGLGTVQKLVDRSSKQRHHHGVVDAVVEGTDRHRR